MSKTVLKVENISKQYRLGQVGTGTISHDLNRWWHAIRGKPDPYLKVGDLNERTQKGESEYVWALKDINFEVKEGEVLGIIGRNGAGKSTLLKLLCKITSPTTGTIKRRGRIASLLEVGTGFHPELTGRENIYLNGAILGMTKREITSKLDEIVDFAGVERYLDTPVKRYSSGMMVRLGFSVAAHLEPEILVVDEVLAVGDAEFQQKCIGKMGSVAKQGRTVLFVSHNLDSISNICTTGILLDNGLHKQTGNVSQIIDAHLTDIAPNYSTECEIHQSNDFLWIRKIKIFNPERYIKTGSEMIVMFHLSEAIPANQLEIIIECLTSDNKKVFAISTKTCESPDMIINSLSLRIPNLLLAAGSYYFNVVLYFRNEFVSKTEQALHFAVSGGNFYGTGYMPKSKWHGEQIVIHEWDYA